MKKFKDKSFNKLCSEIILDACEAIKYNPDKEYYNACDYNDKEVVIEYTPSSEDFNGGYIESALIFFVWHEEKGYLRYFGLRGNEVILFVRTFERKEKLKEIFGSDLK